MESPHPQGHGSPRDLEEPHLHLIESFVRLADTLGVPRSLAQIYGLVFVSAEPVSAQDCVDFLRVSRSSAGQGLKTLKEVGAIQSDFQLGARRETFRVEPDLGKLIHGILEGRLLPAFDDFFSRLDTIEKSAASRNETFVIERIKKLRRWSSKVHEARFLFSG
jgi:DNA-binding transcriptional regulator GbsR (MarR family)